MTRHAKGMRHTFMLAALATALLGCDSAPSESEFTAACMAEGQRGINKAMSREMGITNRQAFCECSAKEAKAVASAEGYHWMMLDMAGRRQEAAAVEAKLTDDDRAGMMKAATAVLGKCGLGMR